MAQTFPPMAAGGSCVSLLLRKQMADFQWGIIHGAITTNRYRAHLDPSTGEGCPFCSRTETLEHLVVSCPLLGGLFKMQQEVVGVLAEVFSVPLFVFVPKYTPKKRKTLVLINFIFASVKLATCKR